MDALRNTLILVIFVAASAGVYAAYRYSEAYRTFEHPFEYRAHYAPSVCDMQSAGFKSSLSARLYTAHGSIRQDFSNLNNGKRLTGHIITTSDGVTYLWYEGYSKGVRSTLDKVILDDPNIVLSAYHCGPWWIPDLAYFDIPDDVEFGESF